MSTDQIYQEFLQSTGICTDTRREAKGSVFFALRGDQFDGNNFVEDALNTGCRLAITERGDLKANNRVLVVPSVLQVLQDLAAHHRLQVAPQVVAITGSNGKTTTKELMASVLSVKYKLLATRGNLNNHIGVPLTLLGLNREELAVIEMGANHPGEIAGLARIAAPDVGIITNVGKAHLEGFGSLKGVLAAKGELYAYLATHGGKAIVNGQDEVLMKKAKELGVSCEVIAPDGELPLEVRLVRQSPFLEVELIHRELVIPLSTRLVGIYNLQNILLAVATGMHFGVAMEDMAVAISGYNPENQRSQMIKSSRNSLVLDSYNANPSSMREAIGGMLAFAMAPIMLILGDMAELGEFSEEEHRQLVEWITSLDVDRVLLAGLYFQKVCEPSDRISVFRGRDELETFLMEQQPSGYHILLKGSRVMGLEALVPLL